MDTTKAEVTICTHCQEEVQDNDEVIEIKVMVPCREVLKAEDVLQHLAIRS